MSLMKVGKFVFFSLALVLFFFSFYSISGKWCAYISSDYVGCFELDDCRLISDAVEVAPEECFSPVCCVVELSNTSRRYYGSVIILSNNRIDLFPFACKNILRIIPNYRFSSVSNYDGSDCQRFDLINKAGFHDLSDLGCLLNVRFSINDEIGPLSGVDMELFQIEEDNGNVLYIASNQYLLSSQYSISYFIPKKCERISRTLRITIRAKKIGYQNYNQQFTYTLQENITQINLLDIFSVVMKKENKWDVTFNFLGVVPDELKEGFFIKYILNTTQDQVFVRSTSNVVNVKIPKPQERFADYVQFIINLPGYKTKTFSEFMTTQMDSYTINVPPLEKLYPITTLRIKLHKNDLSGCSANLIGSVATSFYYSSFQLLYNSVTEFYEADVPIYTEKLFADLTDSEKEIEITILCGDMISKKTENLEPVSLKEIIMPRLEHRLSDCRSANLITGVVSKDSICKKPCRKYFTYDCSSAKCSFSNETWNLIINQPHPGVCDNGFTCDALGNCVPLDEYCVHKNSYLDCLNVDVENGFYYCDKTNRKIFVNLVELYKSGKYDSFVYYCQKCSFDKECRTCNNPNSIFGTKFGAICNVEMNATCIDRLITQEDLQNIASNITPSNIYIRRNLRENQDYYEYCVVNNCGVIDSDCRISCENLSRIVNNILGISVVCDDKENLSKVYYFANCTESSKYCGISKTSICLGFSVLNIPTYNHFIYLVEARGGTIVTNLGFRCSSVPIPLSLPEIGQTSKKLKDLNFEELSNSVKEALNNNRDYFNNNRHKVYGLCYGEVMNFNEDRYCCFNGPSYIPCESPLDLTVDVKINYSGYLENGKYLVFKIRDLTANTEFIVTTDENGIIRMFIPRRSYNFTLLHDVFNYSEIYNLTNVFTSTYRISIILNVPTIYRKLDGVVLGNVSSSIMPLKNIDVKVLLGNTLEMFQYTDNNGKFDFGYFPYTMLNDVTLEINKQYSNPFFMRKIINQLNLTNKTTPYIVYLEANYNTNIIGYVKDTANAPLTGIKITLVGLEELKPINWYSDYKFSDLTLNGSYELRRIPCNNVDPIPLLIRVEHPDYISKTISINSNCSISELNITLLQKSCLKQEVTPENINLSIDNDGNLKVRWNFKCSSYVYGFAIELNFLSRDFVIADLVPSQPDKYEYEFSINLNDLGLLDYAGIRGFIRNITIYSGQVKVIALWEKPFVNRTISFNANSLSFDYGCVKRHWFDIITGQLLKDVLNYSVQNSDIWICIDGTYVPGSVTLNYERYLQNKTAPFALSTVYFTPLTKYQGVSKDTIRSQFCSGPFLAFGTYFAAYCKNLPMTKSHGLLYYYKSCVNVRNCYDYNTKIACEENICLPFECEWRSISEIDSSYALYSSKADKLGVCIPKDPVLINCSDYNVDIEFTPEKFDLIPFMFNKEDVSMLSTSHPHFKITQIAQLFGQRGDKRLGARRCVYNLSTGSATFDRTRVSPKEIKFINKFYYKSLEELRNYVRERTNYGIFDYDLFFDNVENSYSFNFTLDDILNSLPNETVDVPTKKYTLRSMNDPINLTNITIRVQEENLPSYSLPTSTIVIDPDSPIIGNAAVSLVYYYVSPTKKFAYYAIKLRLNITNEDWVIAEGKLIPVRLFLPLGEKNSSLYNYEVYDEFSLEEDGVFSIIEKPFFRMKYESWSDISNLAKIDYNSKKGMIQSKLGRSYEFNESKNEFLIASGVYNLTLILRDKLHNRREVTIQIYLPPNGIFFRTGYYRYYSSLQNATLFIESLISGLDLIECRFGPTYFSPDSYSQYPKIYNRINSTYFSYNLTPQEISALYNSSYILNGKPNGLFRIYSMCKDSKGNYYEIPEIQFYYDNRPPECNLSYFNSFYAYQNASSRMLNLNRTYPTGRFNIVCRDEGERRRSISNISEIYDPMLSLEIPSLKLLPLSYNLNFTVFGDDSYFIVINREMIENDNGWHYLTIPVDLLYKGVLNVSVSDGFHNLSLVFNLSLDAETLRVKDIIINDTVFCTYDKPTKYDLLHVSNSYKLKLVVYNPSLNDRNFNFFKILNNAKQTHIIDLLDDFNITLTNGDKFYGLKSLNKKWNLRYETSAGVSLEDNLSADGIRIVLNYSKPNIFSSYKILFNNTQTTIEELKLKNYVLSADAFISKLEANNFEIFLLETFDGNVTKNSFVGMETKYVEKNRFISILEFNMLGEELMRSTFVLQDSKGYSTYIPTVNLRSFLPYLVTIYTESSLNQQRYNSYQKILYPNKYFCADDPVNLTVETDFVGWKALVKVQIKNGSSIIYENVSNLKSFKIQNLDLRNYVDNNLNLTITLLPSSEYSCNVDVFANYTFTIMPILCRLPEIEYERLDVRKFNERRINYNSAYLISIPTETETKYNLDINIYTLKNQLLTLMFNTLIDKRLKNVRFRCDPQISDSVAYNYIVLNRMLSLNISILKNYPFANCTVEIEFNFTDPSVSSAKIIKTYPVNYLNETKVANSLRWLIDPMMWINSTHYALVLYSDQMGLWMFR